MGCTAEKFLEILKIEKKQRKHRNTFVWTGKQVKRVVFSLDNMKCPHICNNVDLICGKAAVGGSYNSTRDNRIRKEKWKWQKM